MREETTALQKKLEQKHSLVSQMNCLTPISDGERIRSQGYLFKRSTNAFKTWNRRWFMIYDNQLVYQKRSDNEVTIMEEDLRLCTVKPLAETERRFCFVIVSSLK
jgi:PREDICTED: similar to centaurin beta